MTEDRAISLNAVIKAVDEHTNDDGTFDDDISCILEDLPPVTPSDEEMAMQYQRGYIDGFKEGKATFEPKTGHWIEGKCDQCGGHAPFWSMATTYYKSKYCHNCGCRMVEPQEGANKI